MLYPIHGPFRPKIKEGMDPYQIAVILGQLLCKSTFDEFHEAVQKSPLKLIVKEEIARAFKSWSKVEDSIKRMKNHQSKDINIAGFAFDWVLRHRELKETRDKKLSELSLASRKNY